MSFKKRAIIMGLTIGMTFAFAVISVVSIFAVKNLSGQSANVLVSYNVVHPPSDEEEFYAGSVKFYYKRQGDSGYTRADNNIGFNKNNLSSYVTRSLTNEDIELTEVNTYFILCWEISNNTENSVNYQGKSFKVLLNYVDTDEADSMVTIRFATKSYAPDVYANYPGAVGDSSITTSKNLGSISYIADTVIDVGYTHFFYVKVTLKDKFEDAVFSGDFTWTITDAT